MSELTLEARVAAVEAAVANLQRQLPPLAKKDILSIAGSMKDYPEFEDVLAYGRYIRRTGQLPPQDWKPGDPIPEHEE